MLYATVRGHAATQGTVALLLPSLGQYRWDNQDCPDFINEMKAIAPEAKALDSNAEDSPVDSCSKRRRQLRTAQKCSYCLR